MVFHPFRTFLQRYRRSSRRAAAVPAKRPDRFGFRPAVEALEGRIVLAANLAVTNTASLSGVVAGEVLSYNLGVNNLLGATAATNATLTETLPAGLVFVAGITSQGSLSVSGNTVTCNLGTLAAVTGSANIVIEALVTATASGTLTGTASVSSADDAGGAKTSAAVSTVGTLSATAADLSVVVTESASPVLVGQNVTYTVALKNNDALHAAANVTLTDMLPSNTAYVSASASGGGVVSQSGGVVATTFNALAAGAQQTVTITVTPTAQGVAANSAAATTTSGDTNTTNNTAGVTGVVVASNSTSPQRFVAQAYVDVLGRAADSATISAASSLLSQGLVRVQLAASLDHSAEYYATIVTPAYHQFLGRDPDQGGLSYWVGLMQHGLTDEQLQAGFVGSAEYYAHVGGTDKAWVDAMYNNLLNRGPDGGGEAYWVGRLGAGANRAAVAYGFAASDEREGIIVQGDYAHYLGRTAAQAEVAFWVNAFRHGTTNEDVVTGFVGSAEYFNRSSGS